MGALFGLILLSALLALLAASPLFAYRQAIRMLAREGAGTIAYVLLALPAVIVVVIAVWWIFVQPFAARWIIVAVTAVSSAVIATPRRVVDLTGGPSSMSETRLRTRLRSAEEHWRRKEYANSRADLELAAEACTPETVEIRSAIEHRLAVADHSPEARERMHALARAISAHWSPPKSLRLLVDAASTVVLLGIFVTSLGLGVQARSACIWSDLPSGQPSTIEIDPSVTAPDGLLVAPEPRALAVTDIPLDLNSAAESRHDPRAKEKLEQAGFVSGRIREWWATDGRLISADYFEFRDQAGALDYQRDVTRYACDSANLTFAAPQGGVGLQVRYGSGDPIVEQVSWVAGNRRYLVSVTHLAPPADHRRILEIYERAIR